MARYALEFILHLPDAQLEEIKNAIREFGEGLEITDCQDNLGKGGDFKIHI